MGIMEILLIAAVALIVIPPERLPEVIAALGKIMRDLRLASNSVMREFSLALEETRTHALDQLEDQREPSHPEEPTDKHAEP